MNAQLPVNLPDLNEIEAGFKKAMALYEDAFEKITAADQAIKAAYAAIEEVTPGASFHSHSDCRELKEFHDAVKLPKRDVYLRVARKLTNLRCWHYVVDRCGLHQLMDTQAKKELDAQLRYLPERPKNDREVIDEEEIAKQMPPFTAENAMSTLMTFRANSEMIWRRGIANAFSNLDRRFRSHDGFKVGSRMILTTMVSHHGWIERFGDTAETFRDVERTFQILDGRDPRDARSDFLHQVDQERREAGIGYNAAQSSHHGEYFRVDIFKNGNAHLWFTRKDLVKLVNKALAEYYGEVIGDGNTQEPDIFESRAVTPARLFGFYPTPPKVAERIAEKLPYSEKPFRILEPSAGTGNLAFAAMKPREIVLREWWDEEAHERKLETKTIRHRVDAIEVQPQLATALRETGLLNRVFSGDFLQFDPNPSELYDGVLMNPPFDGQRDIDHVTHALKFLKPDGWLMAIMSAGIEFRENKKAAAFRKLLESRGGWMVDLPAGSFSEVGTHVNTVLVGIGMGRHAYHF